MPEVAFILNGKKTTVEYDQGMTFLDVLREICGIVSVKEGCAPQGYCGSCTVLIDRKPALACLKKPEQIEGREVITLEGIPEKQRQLLAKAFVKEGAIQCGFCTPGIMTRASYMMEKGLKTDRKTISGGLAGHLCRCTGYQRIIDAVHVALEAHNNEGKPEDPLPKRRDFFGVKYGLPGRVPTEKNHSKSGVGDSVPRYRGVEFALGKKPFVADMKVDGMLHGAVVLSEHPSALILNVDVSKALRCPGVKNVFTAKDVPGSRRIGLFVQDWPVFVDIGEKTRCVGDVIALVIADTQYRARQAVESVLVEYKPLIPVTDPVKATKPNAPKVHPDGNLLDICAFSKGDAQGTLNTCEHTISRHFETQRIEHAFLEPEACLAVPEGTRLKIYSQGQGVHSDQKQIAAILGVEVEKIYVELVSNGGAFGGKEDLSIQGHGALGAHILNRPVKIVLTREQSLRMHPKRHPMIMDYTVGADAKGRLQAMKARIIGDTGAYASVGAKVLERAAGHSAGPYNIPNVDVEARAVYTNNPACGAMRGFGVNQTAFAIEGILDLLARKIGIDGYTIRKRNILRPGDGFATGQIMNRSCEGLRRCLLAVKDTYHKAKYAGIACGIKNTGIGNGQQDIGRVLIRVLSKSRIEILTGYTEMGQGLFTVLQQVVSEETGLDPSIMEVRTASEFSVLCGMTTASRATSLDTVAAKFAGQKLNDALKNSTLNTLVGEEFHGEYICDFTTKPGAKEKDPVTHLAFGYAAQVVILDDNGKISKIVAAHDVGRAINPLACAGQIEGAIHMGLGHALSEDFPCTGGKPDSLMMRDLGIIKAKDMPEVDVILIEEPDEVGGYGSKGVGEIGLVPTAAAVAGAYFTFDGKRRLRLPMVDVPGALASIPKSRKTRNKV